MDKALLEQELIRDEGEVLHCYQDSEGFWTIGVGRLIDPRRGGGISQEESRYLLSHDIDGVVADLDRALPWWGKMSEPRQRALANMCFNLGLPKLLGFRLTLKHLSAHRYEQAASEMLNSLWARQVGERAERLAAMIREG